MEVPKASQSSPSAIVAILTHDLAAWRAKYSSFIEQAHMPYAISRMLVITMSDIA
ncbi:hypothetical protein ACHAO4_008874 [Trichoderma viride]